MVMVTAKTATIVIMVTAKTTTFVVMVTANRHKQNTPNTPNILVHCSHVHSCLNSRSCPENMCPNLCHGLAVMCLPDVVEQVANNSRRICGPTTTSCLTTCASTDKRAVMLEQDGATWSSTQLPLQRWCSQRKLEPNQVYHLEPCKS